MAFYKQIQSWKFTKMINKELLTQFIYINLPNQLKKCLPGKNWKFITLVVYIEEKEWVKIKILLTNCQYTEKFWLVGIIYKYTKFGF